MIISLQVFYDNAKNMSEQYRQNARAQLLNDLPRHLSKDIDYALLINNFHYSPSLKELQVIFYSMVVEFYYENTTGDQRINHWCRFRFGNLSRTSGSNVSRGMKAKAIGLRDLINLCPLSSFLYSFFVTCFLHGFIVLFQPSCS